MTVNTAIGKITASKETLNVISMLLGMVISRERFQELAHKTSVDLYFALDEAGLYDKYRKEDKE